MRAWCADASFAASIAALLYINTLPNGFVFDDHRAIERNGCVNPAAGHCASLLTSDFWGTPLESPRSHRSYRPLAVLTLRLNAQLGETAAGYHAANALLHAAATWLLWAHAAATLRRRSAALLAALLFAAHPANTEAVAYCVGRADLLAAVLGLGGLRLHAIATDAAARGRTGAAMALARPAACCCLALALAAKETALVLLPACAVFDVLASSSSAAREAAPQPPQPRRQAGLLGRAWRHVAPLASGWGHLAVLALGFVALRRRHVGPIGGNFRRLDNPIPFEASRATRALSTARVQAAGLSLLLWPHPLSADYSYDALPLVRSLSDGANIPAAVLYSSLIVGVGVLLRARAAVPLAWLLLLLLAYAPASHALLRLSFVVAERLLYVPCAAACVLAAAAQASLRRAGSERGARGRRRAAGLVHLLRRLALASLLVAAGGRTMARNLDWRSDATLFGAAAEAYSRSAKATYQLADGLVQAGRPSEAVPLFKRALEIEPDYHYAYLHLARLTLPSDPPRAADLAEASLRALPSPNPHGHAILARALLDARAGGGGDGGSSAADAARLRGHASRAAEHARAAVAADPAAADVTSHLSTLAEALTRLERYEEASAAFAAVATSRPGDGSAAVNVGASLLQAGRPAEALRHFRAALALVAEPPAGEASAAGGAARGSAADRAGVAKRAERGMRAAEARL